MKKVAYAVPGLLLLGGAFLYGSWQTRRSRSVSRSPALRPDRPGIAHGGMQLEAVYTDDPSLSQVVPSSQQAFGIQDARREETSGRDSLRLFGRVMPDDSIYRLSSPDLPVDVEPAAALPPAIAVPAGAVLDTGRKKPVDVDSAGGNFEPHEVDTGWSFFGSRSSKGGARP